ncbi:MAG: signal recognition particle-docking protein FtsY [Methanobrevibacter woesei]|uniref:signal recognition particle-docking protein FtsY n=1 Tax=Methanobrevibacter woesei TaxID=190976 RepID=UPI0023F57C2B|nr:signal recognition particle-docking protein FtsY [Methanobrevibacter woesei]MCI7290991.1 signal recognition particle-docking protein FtsY [Methanobrevibacter woesei]
MFESLKKKFSRTSDKLEEELKEEAQQENNLDPDEKPQKKRSFFSFGRKKEEPKEEEATEQLALESGEDNSGEEVEESSLLSEETTDSEEITKDKPEEEKKSFFSFGRKKKEESLEEEADDESAEETEDGSEEESGDKKSFFSFGRKKSEDDEESSGGFFSFIREKTISEKHVEDTLWELEMGLLEGDVAMEVASEVVDSVKQNLVGKKIKRSNDITEYTFNALRDAVAEIIDIPGKNMTEMIEEKKAQGEPLVVMFVGINGTGKTTTIGKLANYYLKKGYTPVIAASDTFRAGAIEQVNYHADNVGVKLIKHQKGSDPAAVAYDAIEHARAQGKELVLIDTAGRMQTNTNLMDEMKKIKRVANPDLVIFVGDALTGNDATEQAVKFNDAIDVDGVILTKADADSKGGASLSIGYVIKKPILFLGMGQGYDDIMEYDAQWMLNQLFSEDEEEVSESE